MILKINKQWNFKDKLMNYLEKMINFSLKLLIYRVSWISKREIIMNWKIAMNSTPEKPLLKERIKKPQSRIVIFVKLQLLKKISHQGRKIWKENFNICKFKFNLRLIMKKHWNSSLTQSEILKMKKLIILETLPINSRINYQLWIIPLIPELFQSEPI